MHSNYSPSLLGRHKVPLVLQTEAAECGLACLAMVAGYYGHHTGLQSLRSRFNVSIKGMTLASLIDVSHALGLTSRPLRLELNELKELATPCILHWDLNHFVVLTKADSENIEIYDPAFGRKSLTVKSASKHFTGVALELTPDERFEPQQTPPQIKVSDVVGKTYGLRQNLAFILLLALVLEFLALGGPLLPQIVMDHVLLSQDYNLLVVLSVGFALLLFTQLAIGLVRSWSLIHIGTQFNLQWSASVFSHLLRLPLTYFERRHIGDVQSRFSALSPIQEAVTGQAITVVLDGLMAVLSLIMLLVYYPLLALVAAASAGVYLLMRVLFYRPLKEVTEERIVHSANAGSHFLESLRGIQSIRLYGAESLRHTKWINLMVEQVNAGVKAQKYMMGFSAANQVVFGMEGILVLAIGAQAVIGKALTVGMLFAALAYKDQFSRRVGSLIDVWFSLRLLKIQSERLADIVLSERETDGTNDIQLADSDRPAELHVNNLFFSYSSTDRPVVRGCSFTVKAGECVAIAGASGCGKTTLLKLLVGLHEPSQGEILISGQKVAKSNLTSYRRMIGTVMQDDHLFSGNIIDNITFFSETIDFEWVKHCARMAAISEEIDAMPMGYYTLLGDMGTSVSGGQRQRILLARALYRRPKILFLDEATSHLDLFNEERVNQAIKALDITRVIVAHRPSTLALADRVIHIHDGKVFKDEHAEAFSSNLDITST
jgi:ATP-binding cassette subfamily B protein RaxB